MGSPKGCLPRACAGVPIAHWIVVNVKCYGNFCDLESLGSDYPANYHTTKVSSLLSGTHSHSLASAIIIKIILTTFPVVNMQAIHASFYPSSHYHFHKNFPAKSFDSRMIIVIVIALGNLVLRSHRNEYSVRTLHAQRLKKAA